MAEPAKTIEELLKEQQDANAKLIARIDALEKEQKAIRSEQTSIAKAVIGSSDKDKPDQEEGQKPLAYYIAKELAKKEGK